MSDKELAVAPKDNQDIDVEPEAGAGSSASADGFPIEGDSKWVPVMRGLAFSTMSCVVAMAAVFHFLTGDDGFVEIQQLGMMMGGFVFLLILAYFLFLIVVIPRQADYGRYVINKDKVDFYPLTALGLGIRNNFEPVDIGRFMGLTTGRVADKKGKVSYAVYLVHAKNKGKTINIKSFPAINDAEKYAAELGSVLRLNVATRKR